MSEVKPDYEIGYGKPPAGRRFQKGQSGNPRGPRRKDLSALLVAALNEPVYTTIDGHRRKITKREAIIKQMVDKSAEADLRATKMLFDMLREVEEKAGTAPPPEPAQLTAPDREVVELFVARLRRQIAAEAAEAAAEGASFETVPEPVLGSRDARTRGRPPQDEGLF
jgi:pyruvate/2-oxoglutarate dehydrogenase complex dihydrolipoamide acyltransferase (E2) component